MSYYDRAGNPATFEDWAKSIETFANKVVKQETVDGWFVSTVWLGLDHGMGDGPPLIFETMIFAPADSDDDPPGWFPGEYQERYSTEAQALEGHQRALAWLRDHLAVTV